ncbi:MAG: hypothetical protein IJ351_03390 [Oscillospiraceae bacterium]|nr:hypothetical protein [Oscillospiraceae bacterium]
MEKWMIVSVLGFLLPQLMIQAVRAEENKKAQSWGWKAGIVFSAIVALLAMK